jgi:heterodisulfide reductase subunit A
MGEEPCIGVYICHCGGNISDTVDVERVREAAALFKGVKIAETNEYVCSNPGQERIMRGIREHNLNRVVVASCSPRMHLETFRQTVKTAGLNPYLLEMVNIREQCSWIHDDKEKATLKAIDLIRGAVERARYLEPLELKSIKLNRDVLVIGGGVAGIISAIELADKGYQVYLVEKTPSIGGHMAQLSKTFPTLDCSSCILTPKMVYAAQHPNIKILSMSEVISVEGSPGNYRVLVVKHPRFVDEEKCTACGECTEKCPVKVPSEFEAGLIQRKAIYIPFKQAVPNVYTIDKENCLYFTKGVCRLCERFCKGDAVNYDQKEETFELDIGAIIVSTGFEQINPDNLKEYGFGLHPDIVTNLQFERLMIQGIHKPSDGKMPKKVAFILCVGSRMLDTVNGVEHCCKIGCMAAIKQAILLQKAVPNAEPWIFYIDIRADGKGYEEFYMNAQEHGVRFVRGRVAEVTPIDKGVFVRAEDTFLGARIEGTFDLVVLSVGITPHPSTQELAKKLGIHIGSDGFLLERHYKLMPVDSQREGVYICGCALSPKDVRETTLEAMATASRVATFLGRGEISISPEVAYIIPERCDGCGECIKICPVNAIEAVQTPLTVNPISCVGCGVCVPRCPRQAIDLNHCSEAQLLAQVRGVSVGGESPRIIAFLEGTTAYASADLAGQTRLSYSPLVRIIRVPSTGRVGLRHLLSAFAAGADGVVFIEGDDSVFTEDKLREYVIQLKKELRGYGIKPLRLIHTTTTIPQYDKILNIFETFIARISRIGPISEEVRSNIEKNLQRYCQGKI